LCILVTLALVVLQHAVQGSTITSLLQLWGSWLWASPLTSREEGKFLQVCTLASGKSNQL